MSKFPVALDYSHSQTVQSLSRSGLVDLGQQHVKDHPNNLMAQVIMFWSLYLGLDTLIY